jgi:hypothetical protein
VETNVDYPTATRLLFDALRKVIELLIRLCRSHEDDESVGRGDIRRVQKRWRRLPKVKPSPSTDESKPASRQKDIIAAHHAYLDLAREGWERAQRTVEEVDKKDRIDKDKVLKIKEFMNHARRQLEHPQRRVIEGQKSPHQEPGFAIFEPHTE